MSDINEFEITKKTSVNEPSPPPSGPPKKTRPPRKKHTPPPLQKRIFWGIVFLFLAVATFLGIKALYFYSRYVETDDAQIEGKIHPIIPRVSGYVTEVLVRDNEKVNADQPLVKIDSRDLQTRVNRTQEAYHVAEAKLEVAKTLQKKNEKDLSRYEALARKKEISEQQFDSIKAQTANSQAELKAAEADLALRKAEWDYDQLQLSYTMLFSPASRYVSKKNVEIGQFIQPGQSLMAVVPDKEVWAIANFKETQVRHLHPGQRAEIKADTYPDHAFQGHVESLQLATGARFSLFPPENATGNFVKVVQRIPVKIVLDEIPDPEHRLVPGMSVVTEVRVK